MGQQQPVRQSKKFTDQQIGQQIEKMLCLGKQRLSIEDVSTPISLLLQNLNIKIPLQKTESGMLLNIHMVRLLYHQQFTTTILKVINLLIEKLEHFADKNLLTIKKNQWTVLSQLVKFILVTTDQKIIQTISTFTTKLSQLDPDIRHIVQQLQSQKGPLVFISKQVTDQLPPNIAESLFTVLSSTLIKLIQRHSNPINRSSETLKIIQYVQLSLFMLLSKLIFTPQYSEAFIDKIRNPITFKDLLKIVQYFLGLGSDICLPSVYQTAVLILLNIIANNPKNLQFIGKDINSTPSFIFPNLPVIKKRSIYDFIATTCLFSLIYVKQGTNIYQRFAFNRLFTLRLLNILVREMKITNGQMTQFIEQLTLQTKIGMVQRAFITQIVKNYVKLINQKISLEKQIQEKRKKQSMTTSTWTKLSSKILSGLIKNPTKETQPTIRLSSFTRQNKPSQILTKYLQSGIHPYNVRYKNKRYSIPYIDVVDQIQKDDDEIIRQFKPLNEKFTYEFILNKKVLYQHNDRFVWNQILPKIIQQRQLQGELINQSQMSQRQSINHASNASNVMGFAPVISQVLSSRFLENNKSQVSVASNKNSMRKQYVQTQAHEIINQTTQANINEKIRPQDKISQWNYSENIRKFQPIQNESKFTSKSEQKVHSMLHTHNSQSKINQPKIDKNDIKYHTEQFVIEETEIKDN